jgi:hypothetical protein
MHQNNVLPRPTMRQLTYLKCVCLFLVVIFFLEYGIVDVMRGLLSLAVFAVGLAGFATAVIATIRGIPLAVAYWQRRDEFAGVVTLIVFLSICWGHALGLMAAQLFERLNG